MDRTSEAKNPKHPKKVKCDGPTDGQTGGWTDGPTKRVVESRSTRLKRGRKIKRKEEREKTMINDDKWDRRDL